MNNLATSLLFCVFLGVTAAYWLTDADRHEGQEVGGEGVEDSDLLDVFKRTLISIPHTRKLCIPWRSPCTHDAALINKYKFLSCCNDGACKCNLWGNNCRCEATLGR